VNLRGLLFALVCALLLGPTLGLLHGIVHMHHHEVHASGEHEDADANTHYSANESAREQNDFLARLFSGHASDTDCRLYDQCSHADTIPGVAALVLPLVLAPFVFSVLAGLAVAPR
jgi:hypothetical protein